MIYPIGIQDFEKLRSDGYVYVDKTDHIYRLATTIIFSAGRDVSAKVCSFPR